jgi:hypothetical protein
MPVARGNFGGREKDKWMHYKVITKGRMTGLCTSKLSVWLEHMARGVSAVGMGGVMSRFFVHCPAEISMMVEVSCVLSQA